MSVGEGLDECSQPVGVEIVDKGFGERDRIGLHTAEGARDLRGGDRSLRRRTVFGLWCGIRLGVLACFGSFGPFERANGSLSLSFSGIGVRLPSAEYATIHSEFLDIAGWKGYGTETHDALHNTSLHRCR
ncbi:hypothetical protein R1X32_09610 (plasmid) [Rhodococcus opacus]|uniref:hypothetical protein n=1 Tax=Rhodococcus opacus TaxID=37919 RepID=UPI0034D30C6A